MKRLFAFLACAVLLVASLLGLTSCADSETITLNVYNWGEYLSDGSDGSVNVNAMFEEYCASELGLKVRVNYTTYASNEDMYAKLKSGSSNYDVVFPSDYMIARMIKEDMLEKLDYSRIPNAQYIAPEFRGLFYDAQDEYSIPYTYGMIGVIYNTAYVSEEDLGEWDLMWNEKYAGSILQYNNPRDAFGTAMYRLGIDVNTTDPADWRRAKDALTEQKPLVQAYVMDEIYNKMESGAAYISSYYAGDYLTMYESNDQLGFYYPSTTNVFVDAMCVPKGARNKDLAESYINFLLSEEAAVANAETNYYASPNLLVRESEQYQEDMAEIHEDAMEILYPESYNATYYQNLPDDTLELISSLWEEMKIDNSKANTPIFVVAIVILAFFVAFCIYRAVLRRIRNRH